MGGINNPGVKIIGAYAPGDLAQFATPPNAIEAAPPNTAAIPRITVADLYVAPYEPTFQGLVIVTDDGVDASETSLAYADGTYWYRASDNTIIPPLVVWTYLRSIVTNSGTLPPSLPYQKAYTDFYLGAVADGFWASLQLMAFHCAYDMVAARLNFKNPAMTIASLNGTVDFLQANGVLGSSALVEWNATLTDLGCTATSAFALVWSLTDNGSQSDFGGSGNIVIRGRATATEMLVRPIWNGNLQPTVTDSFGLYGWNKGAGNGVAVKNGAFIGTASGTQVSDSLTSPITTCGSISTFSSRRLSMTIVGNTMSEGLHTALYNRALALVTAILGTPPPL